MQQTVDNSLFLKQIPAQVGDILRTWASRDGVDSETVEMTVIDLSHIINLNIDPVYKGDTRITGTINPEASSLDAIPSSDTTQFSAYKPMTIKPDGTFVINGGDTLVDRLSNNDTIFFSASLEGEYFRQTQPVLELVAPRIATISNIDTSLSINAENEGDLLRVTLPSGEVIEEPARRFGRLPVILDAPLEVGDVVTVVIYSLNGGTSEEVTATVIDAGEQFELNVDPIKVGDTVITGTATPGSQVFVPELGGRNVTVDSEGNFTINLQGSASELEEGLEVRFQVRLNDKTYEAGTVTVEARTYPITSYNASNGEVLDLPEAAAEGETVTFRTQPNHSQYTSRVRVAFGGTSPLVDIEINEDGTYSVVMPADSAYVRVAFTNFNANFQPTRPTLDAGETQQFTFNIVKGRGDVVVENPVWSVADESVATVDQNGLVTAVAGGETVVTFTYTVEGNEHSREATVTVIPPVVYTVTIDANEGTINPEVATTEVLEGETFTLPIQYTSQLAKEGYTLVGYTVEGTLLDSDGNEVTEISRYRATYTPTSDVTLTAVWEITSGKLSINLHDDAPATQTDRYTLTATDEDGVVYNLSSGSHNSSRRTWEVEDLPNGTYTLEIDGFLITEAEKSGHPDTESIFTVNEDGTATLVLAFEDDSASSFIRYNVFGREDRPSAPVIQEFGQHTNLIAVKTVRAESPINVELTLADGTVLSGRTKS